MEWPWQAGMPGGSDTDLAGADHVDLVFDARARSRSSQWAGR